MFARNAYPILQLDSLSVSHYYDGTAEISSPTQEEEFSLPCNVKQSKSRMALPVGHLAIAREDNDQSLC